MKQVDSQGMADFLAERDSGQQLPPGTFFQGTVSAIRGSFPLFDVQVIRTGEPGSDGHWHRCIGIGYTPQLGDLVDLVKRDDTFSHVVAPLSPAAFVAQGTARLAPPISITTAAQVVASAAWSAIPGSFTHLWVSWRGRSSAGAPTVLNLRLNDDVSAFYDYEGVDEIGVASTAPFQALGSTAIRVGAMAASAGNHAGGHINVYDYARVGTGMRRLITYYSWRNDANGLGVEHGAGNWRNVVDPVTKLTFSAGTGNLEIFVANLYGI